MSKEIDKLKAWAAGFLDGEGCFSIHRKNYTGTERHYYTAELLVQLRADDVHAVNSLIEAIGCGKVYQRKAQKASKTRGNSKPTIVCLWRSQEELRAVISLLEEYPLRGKKATDYAIWKKAVGIKYSELSQDEKRKLMLPLKEECSLAKQFVPDRASR